jgi:hypothetical protein
VQNEVLPPVGGTSSAVEHARLGRHVEIRHVRVPYRFAVAQAADRFAVHLDVGDDPDLRQALDNIAASILDRRPVEITQPATKCYQLLIAQRLAGEKQHRVVVPSLHDACERDVFQVLKIDAFHSGAQRCAGGNYVG